MLKTVSVAAVAALLAACAATAQPSPDAPPPADLAPPPIAEHAPPPAAYARSAAVDCTVRTVRTGNGVLIEGVVHASRPLSGDYELTVAKKGRSGSSDIVQGGPFDAAPGRSVTLSGAEIGADRGARLRAVLTISENGRELCRRVVTV